MSVPKKFSKWIPPDGLKFNPSKEKKSRESEERVIYKHVISCDYLSSDSLLARDSADINN
jgi:hypothetical protein